MTPLISFVTLAELYAFGERDGWGEQKMQFVETVRMNLTVVPIERDEVLRAYVRSDAYAHRRGLNPGKDDLWIAATAVATEAYLLTADRDCEPLADQHLNVVLVDVHTGEWRR